jgi:hypothetical protein
VKAEPAPYGANVGYGSNGYNGGGYSGVSDFYTTVEFIDNLLIFL